MEECRHFNPRGFPEPSVTKHMCAQAIRERRFDVKWGVVNGGNALCVAVFDRKADAESWRKQRGSAYDVVRVAITPVYEDSTEPA